MKQTIFKYQIDNNGGGLLLALPGDFKILHIRQIDDHAYMWVQHSPIEEPLVNDQGILIDDFENFRINVFYRGTGWEWDTEEFNDHYIGTVIENDGEEDYVWHYFYEFVNE
jgi:hypothetical protein